MIDGEVQLEENMVDFGQVEIALILVSVKLLEINWKW